MTPREKGGRPGENSGQNVTSLQDAASYLRGCLVREAPSEERARTDLSGGRTFRQSIAQETGVEQKCRRNAV